MVVVGAGVEVGCLHLSLVPARWALNLSGYPRAEAHPLRFKALPGQGIIMYV